MPKVKKIRSSALESQQARHEPLGQVIESDSIRGKYAAPIRVGRKGPKEHKGDDEFLDPKTTKRILQLSKENELEAEAEAHGKMAKKRQQQQQSLGQDPVDSDEEEEEEIEDIILDEGEDYIENDQGYVHVRDHALGLSAEDEEIVASMNQTNNYEERRTLADIIMAKIAEKESYDNAGPMGEEEEEELPPLPEKVVEVYTDIGKILSHYTSGKLPKAFKVIPSLSNWEQILYLTRPDMWTPHAMYAATRIFASNLNPKMAQRFYYLVLLDAVRVDIQRNKKLNYHYYIALKKAVYKPAAFFKGILLPLCKEECTLREAAIVASVLQRVSIPVHHSAVAIHKLAQMTEYNGAASIFIRTLLNKKYSLPAPVIASLVQHFASFINDPRTLPVLWHQALLVFVQRYKNEVKDQARESLRVVMKKHFHHKITPEIRRELYGAQAFKDERSVAQSDIMVE